MCQGRREPVTRFAMGSQHLSIFARNKARQEDRCEELAIWFNSETLPRIFKPQRRKNIKGFVCICPYDTRFVKTGQILVISCKSHQMPREHLCSCSWHTLWKSSTLPSLHFSCPYSKTINVGTLQTNLHVCVACTTIKSCSIMQRALV